MVGGFFLFFSIRRCATNQNLAEVHFCIQLDTKQISALAALQTGSVLHLDSAHKDGLHRFRGQNKSTVAVIHFILLKYRYTWVL